MQRRSTQSLSDPLRVPMGTMHPFVLLPLPFLYSPSLPLPHPLLRMHPQCTQESRNSHLRHRGKSSNATSNKSSNGPLRHQQHLLHRPREHWLVTSRRIRLLAAHLEVAVAAAVGQQA